MPVGLTHVSNNLFLQLSPSLLIPPSISLLFCLPSFTFPFPPALSCLSTPLSARLSPTITPFHPFLRHPPRPGSSVSGHDESPGDHATTDAADPPAAGSFPPAAPGPAPAAAGCNAAAGMHTHCEMHTPPDKYLGTNTLVHAGTRTPRRPINSRLVCWRCTQTHSILRVTHTPRHPNVDLQSHFIFI